jgi:hypothetical protein
LEQSHEGGNKEERIADSSFSLEDTCLSHSHPAMKKTLLSGFRMASLENAYSRLARISLTFARDEILKVQLKRGREVSMSYLVSALSEDATRSGEKNCRVEHPCRSLRDSKGGLAPAFKPHP